MAYGLMVYVFCCWPAHNMEEHAQPARKCVFFQNLTGLVKDLYHSLILGRDRERIAPSGENVATTLPPTSSALDNIEIVHAPRPPSITDCRCSQLQCHADGSVSQQTKCPVPLQENSQSAGVENVLEAELKENKENLDQCKSHSESSSEQPSAELAVGSNNPYPSSEDEDVCAICLDEYTFENPRTSLQCNHQYHLSCIYEWMERSSNCAICSKVSLFAEET